MSEKKSNFTRRKFIAVSSAAIAAPIAAPILRNIGGMVPEAGREEWRVAILEKTLNKGGE